MTRLEALDLGFTFDWEEETQPDLSWCECEGGKKGKPRHEHEVLSLTMHDPSGRAVASLGNITDPTSEYARDCEEDLASEYADPGPANVTMIETRYAGPTDHRGSRVVARVLSNRKTRKVVSWDHALSASENHHAAAKALAESMGKGPSASYSSAVDGGGWVFVFTGGR